MALHEMATNAAKYGALSTRRGSIGVSWQVSGDIEKSVELVWQEQGGPTVKAGASGGFGGRLIDHVIRYDLDGSTQINFDPSGVRCAIVFPVRSLVGAGSSANA
jgi:two-component sensor histidine kinase